MWGEAIVRFKKLTNQDLNISPPRTLDYITKQIDSRQAVDISAVEKEDAKARAKDISMKTISCIKLLGGVAAQAGSMVCMPFLLIWSQKKTTKYAARFSGLQNSASTQYQSFWTSPPKFKSFMKLLIAYWTRCQF
jgi:hypothetical protein